MAGVVVAEEGCEGRWWLSLCVWLRWGRSGGAVESGPTCRVVGLALWTCRVVSVVRVRGTAALDEAAGGVAADGACDIAWWVVGGCGGGC